MSLRHQMPHLGPELVAEVLARPGERERAEVIDERVRPDVGDLSLVPRQRDPPWLTRATDREVTEAARDEAPHLVEPKRRQDEVGTVVVELEQLVLVGREPEEVVLLLDPLRNRVVHRALAVDELVLGLELLTAHAVQPCVDVLVDVPVVVDPLQKLPNERLVAFVARPDEEVRSPRSDAAAGSRQASAIWSTYSCAPSPCSSATRHTFVACSSTPVRKNVSSPRWR